MFTKYKTSNLLITYMRKEIDFRNHHIQGIQINIHFVILEQFEFSQYIEAHFLFRRKGYGLILHHIYFSIATVF